MMAARTANVVRGERSDPFDSILGVSESIRTAKAKASRLARCRQVPILLTGETGVGKELFARAIHKAGATPEGPFVAINCGTLAKELLASELFGYADGAYTGAKRGGSTGKLHAAHGGTLFLDEFGELPLELQPQLLRVLESGEYYRIGDTRPRRTRFRLLTATNKDLETEVEAGRFRSDLYYRVAVTTLRLPPLRERAEDIDLLFRYLLDRLTREYELPQKYVDDRVLAALKTYAWPGNVRQLRNVIISMSLSASGPIIRPKHLPTVLADKLAPDRPVKKASGFDLRETERELIVEALSAHNGNLTRAARMLGVAKSTLHYKLKRLGIRRDGIVATARAEEPSVFNVPAQDTELLPRSH